MLANINRLRRDREIKKVFAKGRQEKSPNFSLRYLPNRISDNRFAIVVGTKVDKRSTRRNAIKRQMREIIRRDVDKFPKGFDFILSAYKIPSWPLKQAEIEAEILTIAKKL